jgi:hypothetical protein
MVLDKSKDSDSVVICGASAKLDHIILENI